ncbi:MAG: hypothetical protein JXA90_16920, partial [Planctomycetes bacterium]|nr:hypothetical protein [Planctomycetota bacterium]
MHRVDVEPLNAMTQSPAETPIRDHQHTHLEDGLRAALEAASRFTRLPLLAFDDRGELVGHSGDAQGACSLLQSGEPLQRADTSGWRCPFPSCVFHSSFRTEEVSAGSVKAHLVHCEEDEKLGLLRELAQTVLQSKLDNHPLLDELARVYEEVHWLYRLGDILEGGSDQDATFSQFFDHIAAQLPVSDAEIWVTDPENTCYRCLVSYRAGKLTRNFETVTRTLQADQLLLKTGIRAIRQRSTSWDLASQILHRLA